MSANIYWRPIAYNQTYVPVGAPSSFIAAMTAVFGPPPWILGEENYEQLKIMGAVYGDAPGNSDNPYKYLRGKLMDEEGDSIRIEVWPQW